MNRNTLLGALLIVLFMVLATLLLTIPIRAQGELTITHTTLEDFNAGFLYHTGLTRFDDGEVQLLVVGLAGEWITDTNTTGLPALARHSAVQSDGHILVLGGRDIGSLTSRGVYYTTIDLETHDLADWQETTSLLDTAYPNGGVYWHTSAIAHDRVYVLGGRDNSLNSYDTVSFAPIHADGTVGAWQTTTPLPEGLHLLQAVAVDDRIYVIGGQTASQVARDTVYVGEPNAANGQISTWTPTTSLVHTTFGHMAATHEDKIYVFGGYHPDLAPGYVSPYVHIATVNPATGLIGNWTQLTDMAHNIFGGAGISFNGVLYTTGGGLNSFTTPSDYVGANLIGPSGGIGQWVDTSLIDPVRFYHATVNSNSGWLYVINGSDGSSAISNINRGATIGESQSYAPDGTFTSAPMNLGTIGELLALKWNTTMADTSMMTVTLQYRTKDAAADDWSPWKGPYSSSATPGTVTTTVSLDGNARFVQYQAYLAQYYPQGVQQTPSLNAVQLVYKEPDYRVTIAKEAEPPSGSTVIPGDVISYTMTYSNGTGGMTATQTIILDVPPQYTSYIPGSIFGLNADDSNPEQLRWGIGVLPPGESGVVGFAVLVSPTLNFSTILENRASINSEEGPLRYSDPVTHVVDIPYEIQVTKNASPPHGSEVEPGSQIAYDVHLANSGEITVNQVVLTDLFDPSGVYSVLSTVPEPDTGTDNIWSFGTLEIGEERQVDIVVQIADVVPNHWPVTNQAEVMSLQGPGLDSPVVTHTTKVLGDLVDLTVTDIRLQTGNPVAIIADIANIGAKDAGAFWVELYVKRAPSKRPRRPGDHEGGFYPIGGGQEREEYIWYAGGLASGTGASLAFPSTGSWSDEPFPLQCTTYDIYVQVDVAASVPPDNEYWGQYPEDYETNNIMKLTYTTPCAGGVYFPVIVRH